MKKTDELHEALKYYFGFDQFKGDQEAIIRNLMKGRDTFVLMPTGGGKSLCYQLPALLMEGTAIIVSPLIALMKNQVDAIKHASEAGNVADFLNSSLTPEAMEKVKEHVLNGHIKMLYVAPESLAKRENIDFLKQVKVSFLAVDEAHCISEWGHDFRPEYRRIRPSINDIAPGTPVIALTATATDKVKNDIKKNLRIVSAREYKSSFNRPNLYYEVRPKTKDVDKDVIRFIKQNPGKSGIVYCMSRKGVEDLAKLLQANDINAAAYHAGMDNDVRTATQDDFLMERIDVIVATIAFGMGIDKPDVRYVIHYDIPKSLEGYYQETGRAGRDGGEGRCIAFFAEKDVIRLQSFSEGKSALEQNIARQLLAEMKSYSESNVCRRKLLMHYFGEEYDEDNCGACDNCLHPVDYVDAADELKTLLDVIEETKENHKVAHLIDILCGRPSESVVKSKHHRLDLFGCGRKREPAFWTSLIDQAMLDGYLWKELDNYGVMRLTEKGKQFYAQPGEYKIKENRAFEDVVDEPVATAALDETLYHMLVDLRKSMSRRLKVPPYVIFQDPSLHAMTFDYPQTLDELKQIPGVGSGKALRYGKEFVELIKKYCEENDIVRPEDFRMKSVANRSRAKITIITSIDKQIPLEDIAQGLGLKMDDLLSELESIVYSGTKLDIDYYIEQNIDDDIVDEVYDYFMHSETDHMAEALEALDEDITEDEIRLVRIKFTSEMGN